MDSLDYQMDIAQDYSKHEIEYWVWHYTPEASCHKTYDNKFKAYAGAINPKYWRYTTVVLIRAKAGK